MYSQISVHCFVVNGILNSSNKSVGCIDNHTVLMVRLDLSFEPVQG